MALRKKAFKKKLWKKDKIIFSFAYNFFFPIRDRNDHLSNIRIIVWKCFQFGHGQNFVCLGKS